MVGLTYLSQRELLDKIAYEDEYIEKHSKKETIRCGPVTDENPFAEIHPRKSEDFREWISALAYE